MQWCKKTPKDFGNFMLHFEFTKGLNSCRFLSLLAINDAVIYDLIDYILCY